MTETLRSINLTHPKLPNVTFRIGVYTPDTIGRSEKDVGEQRPVIEIHVRNAVGVTEVAGALFLDQFEDLSREIIKIGNRVVPKTAES
jgi:hypothetical protein